MGKTIKVTLADKNNMLINTDYLICIFKLVACNEYDMPEGATCIKFPDNGVAFVEETVEEIELLIKN
jgi:hypothetical protein